MYLSLSETFSYDCFRSYVETPKDQENYTTEYIKSLYKTDDLSDKDNPILYGVTKYYSKDETPKLLGIETYKRIVLTYLLEKIEYTEQEYQFVNNN